MPGRDLTDPEAARLLEIRLLDVDALRPKIERLTRLAKTIAGTPYAYVTLEKEDHAWTSEFEGLPESTVPREESITAFVIKVEQTIFTSDARLWVSNHPWVAGPPYLRFYCAAPIRLASGFIIGAFCVASTEVKEYDPELGARIEDLADLLADEIERLRAERRRAEAEAALIAARDAAETANRAKSEFLANMSHEIRTPLNGVVGVAAALGRTELTSAQKEMVGLIQTSSEALETILSDVLDFSRIESGRLELVVERFHLEGALRSAAALFEASARAKGLSFQVEVAHDIRGHFEGDAVRIRQVLFNLVSNAVKFTRAGGIEVTAAPVGRNDDLTRVAISVADTGIGFDETVKARLFERFEQGDGSITRQFGGSGLGLAISRALAEAMGGKLEARSRPGKGSRFTLTLPLKRVAGKTAPAAPETGDLATGPLRRVLLAEDHAVNRRVVELILATAGVDLVCVENGRQAVDAAASGVFDLILMDMQMPEMDGLSAIRAIRDHEHRMGAPRTCIWALSANALPEHLEASMAAGADGHLTKPVSAPALFEVLTGACAAQPRPGREARRA